jgi:hypothetical protein
MKTNTADTFARNAFSSLVSKAIRLDVINACDFAELVVAEQGRMLAIADTLVTLAIHEGNEGADVITAAAVTLSHEVDAATRREASAARLQDALSRDY